MAAPSPKVETPKFYIVLNRAKGVHHIGVPLAQENPDTQGRHAALQARTVTLFPGKRNKIPGDVWERAKKHPDVVGRLEEGVYAVSALTAKDLVDEDSGS